MLPARLKEQFENVSCGLEGPRNAGGFGYAGTYASLGIDNSFSLNKFREEVKITIKEYSEDRIIFELINVDVSIANAIRRILIAEVPSVAIETIHLWLNTGVIQDEVLAHRLGLIPFKVNPDLIQWRKENEDFTEDNSLKFKLHVKCTDKDIVSPATSLPVYAKDIRWIPHSKAQEAKFSKTPPAPVEPEILVTKLRPGQEIEAELYAEKGIGQTHAKWSPVATAVYRLLPELAFPKGPLKDAEADELKDLCPLGVFDVEDGESVFILNFKGVSVVSNSRNCTTCRACLERFPDQIVLTKKKSYFILESTQTVPATTLFEKAIAVLKEKAVRLKENLKTTLMQTDMKE